MKQWIFTSSLSAVLLTLSGTALMGQTPTVGPPPVQIAPDPDKPMPEPAPNTGKVPPVQPMPGPNTGKVPPVQPKPQPELGKTPPATVAPVAPETPVAPTNPTLPGFMKHMTFGSGNKVITTTNSDGVTYYWSQGSGKGNQIIMSGSGKLVNMADLSYKGKDNKFWTKKEFNKQLDTELYWCPKHSLWFRYNEKEDLYQPAPEVFELQMQAQMLQLQKQLQGLNLNLNWNMPTVPVEGATPEAKKKLNGFLLPNIPSVVGAPLIWSSLWETEPVKSAVNPVANPNWNQSLLKMQQDLNALNLRMQKLQQQLNGMGLSQPVPGVNWTQPTPGILVWPTAPQGYGWPGYYQTPAWPVHPYPYWVPAQPGYYLPQGRALFPGYPQVQELPQMKGFVTGENQPVLQGTQGPLPVQAVPNSPNVTPPPIGGINPTEGAVVKAPPKH